MRRLRRSPWIVAGAAGAACLAAAAAAVAGGLAISPAILAHDAVPGQVGSIMVTNTTGGPLAIRVTPRPWLQTAGGRVTPDRRRTLDAEVRVSAPAFTLATGAQRVVFVTLLGAPHGGSLYGNIEVVGTPSSGRPQNGVSVVYRLVGNLRLSPVASRRRLSLQIGSPGISGRGRSASAVLAVRNTGNTIDAVSGDATIAGPRGTLNEAIGPISVVPNARVDLFLARATSLPKGSYRVTVSLRQDGRPVAAASRRLVVH
jgi:hypothetical protein